jgi:Na+-translocating ferredoxin:NAD+ oxidoreductase RNF subunit RnfB
LIKVTIDPAKCVGCTKCTKACPVNAIAGTVKQPHLIDQDLCIKCKACVEVCPFKAIDVE